MNHLNHIVRVVEFTLMLLFVVLGAFGVAMLLVYGVGFLLGFSVAEING